MTGYSSELDPAKTARAGALRVSVVIPARDSQLTIAKTLTTVLAQTWTNSEIIVVDDGSTDGTAAILEAAARKDPRVRLIRQNNTGVGEARNRGVRESVGDWIAPLDSDDIWHPDTLRLLVAATLSAHGETSVVYAWSTDITPDDCVLGRVSAASIRGKVFVTLLCHNFLGNGSCTLIRRTAFDAVGGYDPRTSPTEDWDLYLRLAEKYEFMPVNRILVGYRQHARNASKHHDAMAESHARTIEGASHRNPSMPRWLCRWSASHLYMYLAHRSREEGAAEVRKWLSKASHSHWSARLRPDGWWLWATSGKPSLRSVQPSVKFGSGWRWRAVPMLVFSGLLHALLSRLPIRTEGFRK